MPHDYARDYSLNQTRKALEQPSFTNKESGLKAPLRSARGRGDIANMNRRLEIIDPLEYRHWDDLLQSNCGASFFHTSCWARVLHETYRYKPLYFSVVEDKKLLFSIPIMEVKGLINAKRGVSLPFTDYCEPLSSKDMPFKDLFDKLILYGKKSAWKYIEVRGGEDLFQGVQPSLYYYDHNIDITQNEKDIFLGLKGSTRRNIKKAVRDGVEIKVSDSFQSIKEFYNLHCLTRKSHGLPPQPYIFFNNIYKHIIAKGLGYVALAKVNSKTIAAMVCFHFGEEALYKFGASNKKYNCFRANDLLMWTMIKWYSSRHFKRFGLGRTAASNTGLRRFKVGFGSIESKKYYYRYSLAENDFIKTGSLESGIHNKVFAHMPIPMLKLLGSVLYRYAG